MLWVNSKFPTAWQEVPDMNTTVSTSTLALESLDGIGAADHDSAYVFGRVPRVMAPFPFSTRQLVRLLILRSRVRDGLIVGDTR
jgi:hypothetical protein